MINKAEWQLRKVCSTYEQVENYEKAIVDEENKWELHHRRETDEMKSRQQLIVEGKYYDVEPEELIFLPRSEHRRMHAENALTETRDKRSEAAKTRTGEKNPLFGKHHSDETKKKISEAERGKIVSEETKKKISEAQKGKHHSDETKQKMSDSIKEMYWWNNGEMNKRSKECPGESFVKGRLKRTSK